MTQSTEVCVRNCCCSCRFIRYSGIVLLLRNSGTALNSGMLDSCQTMPLYRATHCILTVCTVWGYNVPRSMRLSARAGVRFTNTSLNTARQLCTSCTTTTQHVEVPIHVLLVCMVSPFSREHGATAGGMVVNPACGELNRENG